MFKDLLTGLVDLVYPPHCPVCKKRLAAHSSSEILCPRCLDAVTFNLPPFCPKCSRHLPDAQQTRCQKCAQTDPPFDFAWAACLYRPPLRDLICAFKYNQRTYLRKPFGRFMNIFLKTYRLDIKQFDIITPIPLFPSRLRERGYNQSRLLAEEVSREHKIQLSIIHLARVRNTEHQTLLREKERWTNIRGAFRIKHPDGIRGKNILIIDDLLTTGATVSEAARTLKNAGAATVGILTLAITP